VTTGPARALLRRLGQYLDGFSACFSRQPQRDTASQYIDGLFNDSERKSMQAMHGRLSDPGQYQALQHFITHSPWDAGQVWAQLRATVPVRTGILAIDDTGFPKQGTRSVGVQRQYCGALGKVGNCQVAVSSALIADGRTWPLAYDLYLPVSWTDDASRRADAHIPPTQRFREKWRIALAQVRTILQAGFTITGVVVDADYGTNAAFRAGLERLGLSYGVAMRGEATCAVVGVPGLQSVATVARSAPEDAWESVTWGTGTAGPLTARFCALRVRPAKGRGDRWLLCERSAADERKYYFLHLPATAALIDLVTLARSRWPIEQQYRELKDDLGLDHFEGRTYPGWTHHVVLTAVAFTFLQIERARATVDPRPTLPVVRGWVREIMGLLYVVHNRRLLSMLDSFRRNTPLRR
jgi:SRSO17 transposase